MIILNRQITFSGNQTSKLIARCVALVIATFSLIMMMQHAHSQMPPMGGAVPAVSVLEAKPQPLPLMVSGSGRVTAFRSSDVRPQVNGMIAKRFFEEGEHIKAGDELYLIEDDEYEANLQSATSEVERAKARLNNLETRAKRYADLYSRSAASEQDYEQAQADYQVAKAELRAAISREDIARLNLERTIIKSPISGVVGRALYDEGDLVLSGQSPVLAKIQQIHPVYVDISLSSQDYYRMSNSGESNKGHEVTLSFSDHMAFTETGRVVYEDNVIDQETDSILVRAEFPNQRGSLLPGLFVRAQIQYDVNEDAILIPQRAVVRDATQATKVWIVDNNNTITAKDVSISGSFGNNWIIEDGLKAGDRFVMEGFQKASPGQEVIPEKYTN